ncbi:MAG: hypothetical protein PHG66_00770 [Candidatus Colwellbacteria bacterium]|nr:hypothetical protein [Candidatus Colwellbacteria bacterium]
MPPKKTIEDYYKLADRFCITYVDECRFPKNSREKYKWKCTEGHEYISSYNNIQQGRECPLCAEKKRLEFMKTTRNTKEMYVDLGEEKGFEFIDEREPVGNKERYKWRCGDNHIWESSYNDIQGGHGCPYCYGNIPKTKEDFLKLAERKGFEFIDDREPINNSIKYKWKCKKEGHVKMSEYRTMLYAGCMECYNKIRGDKSRHTEEDYLNLAKKFNIEFVDIYKKTDCDEKYKWKCEEGHIWISNYHKIYTGYGCNQCSSNQNEKFCTRILEKLTGFPFVKIRPPWLGKLELDGYCEKLNLAFEYQGLQHYEYIPFFHQNDIERFNGQLERDIRKKELCKENGTILLCIPYQYNCRNPEGLEQYIISLIKLEEDLLII